MPPTGWEFCGTAPAYSVSIVGDLSGVGGAGFSSTGLTFTYSSNGVGAIDQITITGLSVRPLTPSSAPGNITVSAVSGFNGISVGDQFGALGLYPGVIDGNLSICAGSSTQLSVPNAGGVWTSSNSSVATINPVTGQAFSGSFGNPTATTTITNTIGGCSATAVLTVNENPVPIAGIRDICQNTCYVISDNPNNGIFTGTLVTLANFTPIGNTGKATLCGVPAGAGTVTYTLPSGCFVTATLTVNPLPGPIIDPTGTYEICAGDNSRILTNSTAGGTWSSQFPAILSVDPGPAAPPGGTLYPANPGGISRITYTLPVTGCAVDTPIRVYPSPGPITGPNQVCVGSSITLSNATPLGTWTSANNGIAVVTSAGVVTGVSPGSVNITYQLAGGGCFSVYNITVNPVPDPITGPTSLCQGSTITLASTTAGGSWFSSNTTIAIIDMSTGIATAVNTGVVVFTYSLTPTGCTALYTVTVNPNPDTIRGATSVCQGQCINLSSATPGGNWVSLQPGFASASNITGGGGLICGIQVSTVIIQYILPTGCYTTTLIDVNPLDTISGPTHLCARDSIHLINNTPGGGAWSNTTTTVGTIDAVSGWYHGVAAGVDTVKFITPAGCTTSFIVTVDPTPDPIVGDTAICLNDCVQLSTTSTGGTWFSVNPVIATVDPVTGVMCGVSATYTTVITYSFPSGCFSSHTVTVNNLPGVIFGPTNVCQGFTITLIDTPSGGTWTSSDTNVATIDSFTGVLTGVTPGTTNVRYWLPTGCFSDSVVITVHDIDTTTGPAVVCAGDSIQLVNNTAGTPGTWSSSNVLLATVTSLPTNTVTVIGVDPGGTANITYTTSAGCINVHTVIVNPRPGFILGPTQVCEGDTINLTSSGGAGTWSSSNPGDASVDLLTGQVIGIDSGVVIISYTFNSTGCVRTTTITVHPRDPIVTFAPNQVCVGQTQLMTNPVPGGFWTTLTPTITTVGVLTGVVTGVTPGIGTIQYTTPFGCISTATIEVMRLPDSITGPTTVCPGDTIRLFTNDSLQGVWSLAPPGLATIDTGGLLTGINGGQVRVTFTFNAPGMGGCSITDTVRVFPRVPAIVGSHHVCIGSTIFLSNANDSTGVWTNSNTSIVSLDTTGGVVKVTGLVTSYINDTFAIITITMPTGCIDTHIVYVEPLPILSVLLRDSIICKGDNNVITVSGNPAVVSATWSPMLGLTCSGPGCLTTIATPTISTQYTVTATTVYGCKSDTTVMVWVDSALNNLRIVGDSDICVGECTRLLVSGGQDSVYLWTPFVGLSCTNCQNPYACPGETTIYTATAVDFMGCVGTVSHTVTVNPLPVLSINPNPVIICKRTPKTVTVSGAGPDGKYRWTPNVFINCDTCATVVLTDTANIIYEVTGTTIHGCMDSISVLVSVLDTNANWVSNDTIICIGDTIQLKALSQSITSNLNIPTYKWSPAESLSTPNNNATLAYPTVTTVYTVVITANVCDIRPYTVQVTVEPLPAIVTLPGSATVVHGSSIQLLATAPNVIVSDFAWAPAATLSCDTCDNPIATPVTGTTIYTVTAISNFGCIAKDTLSIHTFCDNSQIWLPNTFTPNGDGINDRFYISGKGISNISMFRVFNRWGQLIYEKANITTNDPSSGWDGTYKGYVLPPDVFYYQVIGQCELGGEPFSYSGDISIVR